MQECDVCDKFCSIFTVTETADGRSVCSKCLVEDYEAASILANLAKHESPPLSSSGSKRFRTTKYQNSRQNYLVNIPK